MSSERWFIDDLFNSQVEYLKEKKVIEDAELSKMSGAGKAPPEPLTL